MTHGSEPESLPKRRALDGVLALGRDMLVALPPAGVAGWALFHSEPLPHGPLLLALSLAASAAFVARQRTASSLRARTLSSVLSAFREGDFSVRARVGNEDDATREVLVELNHLGDTLRAHRLSELEAWGLLRKVMAEVDVVVLAFSESGVLRLANDAAARVIGRPAKSLLGMTAEALGVLSLLEGGAPRMVKESEVLGPGPWELRRGGFRLAGETHMLVVLADVSGPLRAQERDAWKRLIRVLGHELNNSLAPIQSIAENLKRLLEVVPRPSDWEEDVVSGLTVVERRAAALGRFMTAYAQLARLPSPKLSSMSVSGWVKRAALLDPRGEIDVVDGPECWFDGDADQLDQLLINLLKNAVEANREMAREGANPRVRVLWAVADGVLEIVVADEGPGVSNTTNLFVPFFTTKPAGSGIGLALSRQIAEAHGGGVTLRPRKGGRGAEAVVSIPVARR